MVRKPAGLDVVLVGFRTYVDIVEFARLAALGRILFSALRVWQLHRDTRSPRSAPTKTHRRKSVGASDRLSRRIRGWWIGLMEQGSTGVTL